MKTLAYILGFGFLLSLPAYSAPDPVIVHEWGTFTALQDSKGNAIGRINVDDEPAPPFVFRAGEIQVVSPCSALEGGLFGFPPYGVNQEEGSRYLPFGDPSVTMRLETPVLYFYPPKGQPAASVPPLEVHVDFRGGILGQFYPYAIERGTVHKLMPDFSSGLTWNHVRLGSTQEPVRTTDKVWTTPREVSASLLQVKGPSSLGDVPETEHFLFYRGLGHLDSPLSVQSLRTDTDRDEGKSVFFQLQSNGTPHELFHDAWLVDIHADGQCAYKRMILDESVWKLSDNTGIPPGNVPSQDGGFLGFSKPVTDFSADNLAKLKDSMQQALVKEGLYPDEASAMLRTWELSYFKSPGLRLFYIVPKKWVDQTLPLQVTGAPTEITRVMVGRIELVSDEQKAILTRLAAGPSPDLAAVKKAAVDALKDSKLPKEEVEAFYRGEKPLRDLGISIPQSVQDYLDLGRFRDALIIHEQQEHPSAALAQFIKDNRLSPVTN